MSIQDAASGNGSIYKLEKGVPPRGCVGCLLEGVKE